MKNLKKYSFTLIELMVAIIVVGIVITAIPALLNRVSHIQETTIKNEYFFNSFALVSLIQTQEWDENNTQDDNYYKVLTAEGGDSELKCIRKGVKQLDNESGADCATDNKSTSTIGVDSGENSIDEYDDIDDFNGYSTIVKEANISVDVKYWDDSEDYSGKNIYFSENDNPASGTNVKLVEVNVTNKNTHELMARLKYFSSNIGMVKIESRNE
jgi:prepilin-type N-terminal cleavage/methylation domain-containing protein